MRALQPFPMIHSRSDSDCARQMCDLAGGSRSEPWGCRSSAQSEVLAFIVTGLGGRVRPRFRPPHFLGLPGEGHLLYCA